MTYEIKTRHVRKSVRQFLEVFDRTTVTHSIVLALMLTVILPSPMQAQPKTNAGPSVGGPGGGDYSFECPTGSYMGALKAHHGAWIDSVAVVCRKLSGHGFLPGVTSKYFGGNSGGQGEIRCDARYLGVITGLSIMVANNEDRSVGQIRVECGNVFKPQEFVNKEMPDVVGKPGNTPAIERNCPAGYVGNGIFGKHGVFVDRIGLLCVKAPQRPIAR
jgi:hypothetical protein